MNAQLFQEEQGCFIPYKNLIRGVVYATTYPDQGWYIFKHGEGHTWWSSKYASIEQGEDDFIPSNGFYMFRLPTSDEFNKLNSTKLEEYEIY